MGKVKGFLGEFREFASRGNVMDMAVGVIIGGAFKGIIDSVVADIIMPVIGIFTGKETLADLVVNVGSAQILLGKFISTVINFIIIAFVIFCMVKLVNRAHERAEARKAKPEEPAVEEIPAPTTEELLSQILAELKKGNGCDEEIKVELAEEFDGKLNI